MPGSPATSPRVGAPRYSDADAVSFASQVNAVTDAFDAAVGLAAQGEGGLTSKSANYTAVAGDAVLATAALTLTLPTAPANGASVVAIAEGGAVTVQRGGSSDTITSYGTTGQTSISVPAGTAARLRYLSGAWHLVQAQADAGAAVASLRTLGTGANQAAAGNDARLSDARTPTAHKTTHEPGGTDALTSLTDSSIAAAAGIAKSKLGPLAIVDADVSAGAAIAEAKLALASDAAAGTPSRRTLGGGAQQAAAGNDARIVGAAQQGSTLVGGGLNQGDAIIRQTAAGSYFYRDNSSHAQSWSLIDAGGSTANSAVEAGFFVTLSDDRLKAEVTALDGLRALATVRKLRGVKHSYRTEYGSKKVAADRSRDFGFIAQEVREAAPEVVSAGQMPDGREVLGLDYMRLIPLLTEAIKYLADRVEALEAA